MKMPLEVLDIKITRRIVYFVVGESGLSLEDDDTN